MIRTGLYGGTFDPVHKGHIEIAKAAAIQFHLDELWFMPAKIPPHKQNKVISCEEQRLAMLELALENMDPAFSISTFELERKTTSYSYITLQELTKAFPDREFYFIIGGDSLRDFETWKHPEIISKLAKLLVAPRSNAGQNDLFDYALHYKTVFDAEIYFLDMPLLEISSTDIREGIEKNMDVSQMLPANVYDYILKNRLYK